MSALSLPARLRSLAVDLQARSAAAQASAPLLAYSRSSDAALLEEAARALESAGCTACQPQPGLCARCAEEIEALQDMHARGVAS